MHTLSVEYIEGPFAKAAYIYTLVTEPSTEASTPVTWGRLPHILAGRRELLWGGDLYEFACTIWCCTHHGVIHNFSFHALLRVQSPARRWSDSKHTVTSIAGLNYTAKWHQERHRQGLWGHRWRSSFSSQHSRALEAHQPSTGMLAIIPNFNLIHFEVIFCSAFL